MKLSQAAALLLLGAIWGASFSFINIAVQALHPLFLMFLRVLLAGLVLAGVAHFRQRQQPQKMTLQLKTHWRHYLLVGLLNCALPFSLIAFSELRISVSVAAILNSTTPLFTAVIAASWVGEKLNGRKVTGLLLGVMGVIVLVGGGPVALSGATAVGVVASLLGAMSYGAGAVYAARHMKHLPPLTASMVQLLSAALILAIPTALQLPANWPGTAVWLSLLALSLLSTCVAYLIFYALLQNVGAS
ncbi:MAG: EamA family transporter, partial [Anaerolineales bacterium]|nr:EamA family transporter [Anaerolineales bacterium]